MSADDVASAAYQYLSSMPDVLAVVGAFPVDDPNNAGVPWIFQRNIAARMETASIVKGTQAVALVCCFMGNSSTPSPNSTARGQRLEVDIWVDPLRDSMGNVSNPSEAEQRGNQVFAVIDSHLHRVATDQNVQVWGNLVTAASSRMTEPVWYPVPDGDGLLRGACFYDVMTFGNTPLSALPIG